MPRSLRLCLVLYKIAGQDYRQLALGHILLLLISGLIYLWLYEVLKKLSKLYKAKDISNKL